MSNHEEVLNNENISEEQRIAQSRLPPPPPTTPGEGSRQPGDQLDVLSQLLEKVLANQSNTRNNDDGSSARTRVSKAQRDFHQQKPPTFSGENDTLTADRWLSAIEEAFRATAIHDDDLRLMTAPSLFRDEASLWWETEMETQNLDKKTWSLFKTRFLERYFPRTKRFSLRREFERLYQGSNTVEKYRQEFNNLSRYALDLISTDELACWKFENGLNIDIQLGLAGRDYPNLSALVDAAVKYERILNEKKRRENKGMGRYQGQGSQGNRSIEQRTGSQGRGQG